MRSRFILIAAILLGIFTSTLLYLYLSGITAKVEKAKYAEVIVAAKDIPVNTTIKEDMLVRKKIPVGYNHPLSVSDGKKLAGKVTTQPVTAGMEILSNQVINLGDRSEGLSYAIPIGKRAMSVPVDDVTAVGGMLKPGDWVDVISTLAGNENPPVNYTAVVLERIQVLAVGNVLENAKSTADAKSADKKTVTLAVEEKEALKLKMAVERGTISLLLRAPTDTVIEKQKPITVDEILKQK